ASRRVLTGLPVTWPGTRAAVALRGMNLGGERSMGFSSGGRPEPLRPVGGKLGVRAQAELEPAANEIARGGRERGFLLMTTARAQVTRPATRARRLGVHMPLGQKPAALALVQT